MTRLLPTSVALLGVMAVLLLVNAMALAAPRAATRTAKQCATPSLVGGRVACLRKNQPCKTKYQRAYRKAGLDCRRVGRKGHKRLRLRPAGYAVQRGGRVLALGPSGRPTFRQALWNFEATIGPLPGVKTPRGAVGKETSGTSALKSLERYAKRLTRRQRRALQRALTPDGKPIHVGRGRARSAAAGGLGDIPQIVAGAKRRLEEHGVVFEHRIALYKLNQNAGAELANSVARWWSLKKGTTCDVSIRPRTLTTDLTRQRATVTHELMHCAAAEQAKDRQGWLDQPKFLDEGVPEWAAYTIADEWSGGAVSGNWWGTYLGNPAKNLFGRAYDAVGWWSLVKHEGADPFSLLPRLVRAGDSGEPSQVYRVAESAAGGARLLTHWGPTLAGKAAFGRNWNLKGPGQPERSEFNGGTVDEDSAPVVRAAEAHGADEFKVHLDAEVIAVDGPEDGSGLIHDSDGSELDLTSGDLRYCTMGGGCECPDGTKLDYPPISTGEAHVGFATTDSFSTVAIEGMTVDDACEPNPTGEIDPKRGLVGGIGLGLPLGPVPHRWTATSLLGKADSIVDDAGLYLATYDKEQLGVYFRPTKAGRHDAKDKVVGVLTYSNRYSGRLKVGDPFPAPDSDCAPADRRSAPGGGPRRVSACIYNPGGNARDIVYMSASSQTRAGQTIAGVGVFEAGVGTTLFNALVQGALEDLDCENFACD